MSSVKSKADFVLSVILLVLSFLFATAALAQTSDLRINDDTGTSPQIEPAIAMNQYGQGVAVWRDSRGSKPAVYAQMITCKGFFNKKNFKVNDDDNEVWTAGVAINDLGHFVVVWESRSDSVRLLAQRFANNGVRIGGAVRVDTHARPLGIPTATPEVGIEAQGDFTVCWTDLSLNSGDVLIQRFNSDGTPRGGNVTVNTVTAGAQQEASMAMNADGDFVVAWSDDRLSSGSQTPLEIFAQAFDSWGQRRGGNFQVSNSPAGISAGASACAMQPNGEFMICWNDLQNYQRIYASSFNADALALSKPFAVSDTVHSVLNADPDICTVMETSYAIAWKSMPVNEIVMRTVDRLGNLGVGPGAISDVQGTENNVSLSYSEIGFVALFEDDVNGNLDIYGKRIGVDMPLHVYGGSDFQGMVPLTWDANYGRTDISRYRIQRREGLDPYVDVAVVDLASRGAGGANMRDWIDTTVVAGHSYSYVVYGLVGTNPWPSLPAVATPATSRPRVGAEWAYEIPVIDGVLGPGEWADAEKVTLGNPYAPKPLILFLKYRYQAGEGSLYIAVDDENDEVIDPANALGMLFDLDANGKWDAAGPSKEGMISINNGGATFTGYWGNYPNALGADAPKKADGIESKISTASGHVQYEVALDLNTSPLKHTGDDLRVAFWVTDPGNFYPTHYGNAGEWPLGALWECAAPLGDLRFYIPAVRISDLDWPMARKRPDQWAYANAERDLKPPFQYQYDYGDGMGIFREMAVFSSTLFATAKDAWTVPDKWKLYAFDIPTGILLWKYTLPGSSSWAATHPAVNDSLVLVGDGGSENLYALGRRTGKLRWQKHLKQLEYQDPIIDGNRAFIVSDSLYCLDVHTGRTVWHATAGYTASGILAVDEANVFYADRTNLGSWDKANGNRIWLQNNNGQPSVLVDKEKLYSFNNEAFYFRRKSDGGFLWGTNMPVSFYDEESNVLAATDSFTLVRDPGFREDHMNLMAVNKANKHIEWGWRFDSTYISPPAVTRNIVYMEAWSQKKNVAKDMQSSLIALDLWTGEVVATIYDSAFGSGPILAQGKLFITTNHSVRGYSNDRITRVVDRPALAPPDYALLQNFPNPFNPSTTIRYRLDTPGRVSLRIYNAAGQLVRILLQDAIVAAGAHEARWDGRGDSGQLLATGVYLARLQQEGSCRSIKILLLK